MRERAIAIVLTCLLVPACLFSAQAVAGDATAQSAGPALPRYRLEVGQELVYEQTNQEDFRKAATDAPSDQMQWRVFVIRRNDDGSWRLVVRTKITFVNSDGSVRAKRHSLGYCDLQPDGSYSLDERTAVPNRLIPDELFCRLPATETGLSQGWTSRSPVLNYGYTFHVQDRQDAVWQITAVQETPYEQMHGWQTTKQFAFDTNRGLVKSITTSFHRGGQLTDRRTIELTSSQRRDPEWLDRFRSEFQAYMDAHAKWAALSTEAYHVNTLDACRTVREKARALLVAGRQQAKLDVVRESYDANLETHDADEKWATSAVKQRGEFLTTARKFPTTWKAKNLDGGTFRLADHRGQVIVLDFWGTNCEYCVLMAPQVRQLADEYRAKDVVFLGVFDRREADDKEDARARSLIESTYQGFSHVEGKEIAELYRLRQLGFGYPVLVILDQSGVAHEVHHGYSADMPNRLRTVLDGMLSKPAKER